MLWKSGEETTSSAWAGGDSRWARGAEEGLTSGRRPWGNPFSASEVERHERFGDSWGTRPSFSLELQGFSFKQVF